MGILQMDIVELRCLLAVFFTVFFSQGVGQGGLRITKGSQVFVNL